MSWLLTVVGPFLMAALCIWAIRRLSDRTDKAAIARRTASEKNNKSGSTDRLGKQQAMPARLSTEAQWHKLSKILQSGVERSARIQHLNAAASVQIDAAEHALDRLFDEIASFIPSAQPRLQPVAASQSRQNLQTMRLAA